MGWGTDFTVDIYLSRQIFNSSFELEDKIKEIEKEINDIKSRILMYGSSNVKDILPEDWNDEPISFIHNSVSTEFESLDEKTIELYKLNLYKETNPNFDKKQI